MSVHPIPSPTDDPADSVRWQVLTRVKAACELYLRPPTDVTDDGTTLSLVFDPDLTAGEDTRLAAIIAIARGQVGQTPTEWEAIEPDIAGLRTYQGLPSPTLAQTVLAVKAQSRILRALLRD